MKIRLERDVLAEAVQWAARSLPLRPSVPILAGLLVRAESEGVTFSSFDYETSAQIHVTAAVADEGQALVSGRLLADICRSLPAKPVDITADDTKVELICGSARFTLQTLPVADYPVTSCDARGHRDRPKCGLCSSRLPSCGCCGPR